MANSLGALRVSLGLDAAEFTSGLTKAEYQTQKFAQNVNRAIVQVGKVVGALEIGRQVLEATKAIISEAAALDDLSDATGSSVESLSRLSNQAKISGKSFEEFQGLVLKLAGGMGGIDDDSNKVIATLHKLGVTTKDPVEALNQVALKFSQYADGANKAGLARDLFGKNGPAFVAALKDIAEAQDVVATTSTKQAAEAERLEKAYRRLGVESTAFKNIILNDVVPALANAIEQMVQGTRIAGGFFEALRLFGSLSPFDNVAEGLTKVRKELDLLQLDKANAGLGERINASLGVGIEPKIADAKKRLEFLKFVQRQQALALIDPSNEDRLDRLSKVKPEAPKPFGPDKTSKRILDGQLKDLDNFIKAEQDTLQDRERFLSLYYQDDQLGLRDFFSGRQAALDEAIQKELGALDKQADLLRNFAKKAKPEERIEAETKLADVLAKRSRLEQDGITKGTELYLEEARAVKGLRESIEQASIALAEMRGDSVTAAVASFDFANRQITAQLSRLKASGKPEDQRLGEIGEKVLSDTRELVSLRAQLSKATQDYSLTLDELNIAQTRVDIAEQSGSITAFAALTAKSELTAKYVEILKSQLATAEAIAQASGKREDIDRVEQLKVQLEQLAGTYDLVARNAKALQAAQEAVFDIGASALESLIVDGAKASDVLKNLEKDILRYLTQQALMQVKNNIFGGPTTGTDIFSLLANKFGGGADVAKTATGAAGATAANAALTTLSGTTTAADATMTTLTTVMASLTGSATSAATALATIAATQGVGGIGGLFGAAGSAGSGSSLAASGSEYFPYGGGYANGTKYHPGGLAWVGEHGPELLNLNRGAQVFPMNQIRDSRGATSITVNTTVMPGATAASVKQTKDQVAGAVMQSLRNRN